MKKILTIVAAVAIIAAFILFNTVLGGYTGTYHLNDGHEWTDVMYSVTEGDADNFSVELMDAQKIKVKYKGDYDLVAELKFTDVKGRSMKYSLRLYEDYDAINEEFTTMMDLVETE